MSELAYVNGSFGPVSEAKVSIEDRGFQFGDGVYEVIAVYQGRPFLMDRHMRRLRGSAKAIGIAYDFDADPLESIVESGLRRSGLSDALVYVQLTRGAAPRSHVIPPGIQPTLVMTFKPLPLVPEVLRQRGAALMTVPDPRWAHCSIKAITLLPNILARNDALARGFDDALFVGTQNEVRECTSANIFMIHGRRVITPPRDESVLHGITQDFLRECTAGAGLTMFEERFDVAALVKAEEAFLSSTIMEVLAVTRVNDHVIGPHAGPRTRRLFEEFRARSRPTPAEDRPRSGGKIP